jgi:hypothetical protein
MSLFEQIKRNQDDITRCRAQLAQLEAQSAELNERKRKLDDPDLKRKRAYQRTDAVIETDDFRLVWGKEIRDDDACHPHCLNSNCYYLDRMHIYTGYYESALDPTQYYCDVCVLYADLGTDEALKQLRAIVIDEALGDEADLVATIETPAQTEARFELPDEWRYITADISICEAAGCDDPARYYLRGSETGSYCVECFKKYVKKD